MITSDYTPAEFIDRIEDALLPFANAWRAQQMKAYLRGQFNFLGIQAPKRRRAVLHLLQLKHAPDFLFSVVHKLWEKKEREYCYIAIDLLLKNNKILAVEHANVIKNILQNNAWWDTVDGLASIVNKILFDKRAHASQTIMDNWVTDSNFWVRRVAMIHQLGWRNQTDKNRLAFYAETLSSEKEFFIAKAIGWAFRDYAKYNPDFVSNFMRSNGLLFRPLTVREATKYLKPPAAYKKIGNGNTSNNQIK